jgi:hypothetical protein
MIKSLSPTLFSEISFTNGILIIRLTGLLATRRSYSDRMILLIWGLLIVLLTLSACSAQPSNSEVKKAKSELTTMLNTLYVPQDAVKLAEKITYGDNAVLRNCEVIVTADISYQSPHDFKDVLDDYRQTLAQAGWEPSPNYRHDRADIDFLDLSPKSTLTISATPLNPDIVLAPIATSALTQTLLTYYIQVNVHSPSIADCRAG